MNGVEGAGGGQLADPGLGGRILGQLVERRQRARGDDLARGVPVGRDQVEFLEAGEHLGLVSTEHRGHAGRLERAGLGHLGAAGRGQLDGVVGRDDAGDGRGGELADRVPGHHGVGPAAGLACVSSSWASSVAATTSGCVTAVSVISSAVAVVPRRTRSSPLMSTRRRYGRQHPPTRARGEHARGLGSLSGREQCEHVFKRTL